MRQRIGIPVSDFEYSVEYERPKFDLWLDRASVVQAVYDALQPWSLSVDDVQVVDVGKPSEQGIIFRLPLKRATFFFGPSSCKFNRSDMEWRFSDDTIEILNVALSALLDVSGLRVALQRCTLALHLQPANLPFIDVLRPLLSQQIASMQGEGLVTMAFVAKWRDRRVVVDGSSEVANGVFLKLERDFPRTASTLDISQKLVEDVQEGLAMLNVEEDLP